MESLAEPPIPETTPAAASGNPSPRRTVLVIDDNHSIVDLVRYGLTLQGQYHVLSAYTGAEGLSQFFEHRPECVIVDVHMPGIDGFQVVRTIRGDPATANTPLVILSALTQQEYRMIGLLSGVDEYLPKPFKASELCAALDRVFQITPEERARRIQRLAENDGEDPEGGFRAAE